VDFCQLLPEKYNNRMPFLEYMRDPRQIARRVRVMPIPYVIGRAEDANFVVSNPVVSGRHAELFDRSGELWIRDLNSRNGTHVNGRPITECKLADGDIIHVASTEFRFVLGQAIPTVANIAVTSGTMMMNEKVPPSILYGRPLMQEMLQSNSVRVVFQPIVEMDRGQIVAYEALGRGCAPKLSTRPAELFFLAKTCGMTVELSHAFRRAAARAAAREVPAGSMLFCNIHPDEITQLAPDNVAEFIHSLPRLRDGSKVVLEVHEDAVAEIKFLQWLRKELSDRGVGLAYDDFGAGQSRLAELAEVPPDFVKLDMQLVQGIDKSPGLSDTVQALCELCEKLGVAVVAEGIETLSEMQVCKSLGCKFGQGYFIGHPEFSPKNVVSTETIAG
jgi:EAL domain-containing protein (putative c-di-GMP-specific phosphodiesterase class I)